MGFSNIVYILYKAYNSFANEIYKNSINEIKCVKKIINFSAISTANNMVIFVIALDTSNAKVY